MDFDLLIKGGRVIDPASRLDADVDVGFRSGKVAAISRDIPREAAQQVVDASGALVTPGLIDLHTHVYWGGTSLGVDADSFATQSGTTTFVDAGSAGAGNFLGFRRHVIERSRVRILAYLNISFAGIFGFSSSLMVGECENIRLCDPREAVWCARDNTDLIVGMKVRAGRIAGGTSGVAPLDMAIEAADALHLTVMAHMDLQPPSRSEVMARLRPGDVLTHCYRPFPNAAIDGNNRIWDSVQEARARGVFFDLGHGMGSLDFDVARRMIESGFAPDAISSDVHLFCIEGPAFDNLVCMSKLLVLGMSLNDVIASATRKPAAIIGREDLGRLSPGSVGDAAILRLLPGEFPYADATGKVLSGDQRLVSDGIVFGGEWRPNEGPVRAPVLEHFHPHRSGTHAETVARVFGTSAG